MAESKKERVGLQSVGQSEIGMTTVNGYSEYLIGNSMRNRRFRRRAALLR